MKTIFKREMSAYFRSPVAYVVIGLFVSVTGLFFWMYNILSGSVYFGGTLNSSVLFLTIFCPVLTMRLFADEKRNGTEVLLRTAPVSMWSIVLGKFLAAYCVFAIMTGITIIFPIVISFYAKVPFAETLTAYIGFLLIGAVFIAIGLFASALTESQVVAALVGIVISLATYFMSYIGTTVGGKFGSALAWLSPLDKFADFSSGILNFATCIFYISFAGVMIFITYSHLERKRWS